MVAAWCCLARQSSSAAASTFIAAKYSQFYIKNTLFIYHLQAPARSGSGFWEKYTTWKCIRRLETWRIAGIFGRLPAEFATSKVVLVIVRANSLETGEWEGQDSTLRGIW